MLSRLYRSRGVEQHSSRSAQPYSRGKINHCGGGGPSLTDCLRIRPVFFFRYQSVMILCYNSVIYFRWPTFVRNRTDGVRRKVEKEKEKRRTRVVYARIRVTTFVSGRGNEGWNIYIKKKRRRRRRRKKRVSVYSLRFEPRLPDKL